LLILFLSNICKPLIVIKESGGSRDKLRLIDAPRITKLIQNIFFLIENTYCSFASNKIETYDTIRNSQSSYHFYPSYLGSVVTMSPTACFSINSLYVNYPQRIAWHHSSLVKVEAILFLCLIFIHEILGDGVTFINNPVCFILY